MPTVSPKQHNFFEWIDHTPGAAEKAGVPKSVAHEFVQADMAKGKDSKVAKMLMKKK